MVHRALSEYLWSLTYKNLNKNVSFILVCTLAHLQSIFKQKGHDGPEALISVQGIPVSKT